MADNKFRNALATLATLTALMVPGLAHAATADCSDLTGTCEVSNDGGQDFITCECASGLGFAGGGGNDWAGLDESELEDVCFEELLDGCSFVPPEGFTCEAEAGTCTIENGEDEDSADCSCASGDGGGFGGFNIWPELTERQMLDACLETVEDFCGDGPPPSGVSCETPLGVCNVDNDPQDSWFCECASGLGGGGAGGNTWAGLNDDQLYDVCLEVVAEECEPVSTSGDDDDGSDGDDDEVTSASASVGPTSGDDGTGSGDASASTTQSDDGPASTSDGSSDGSGSGSESGASTSSESSGGPNLDSGSSGSSGGEPIGSSGGDVLTEGDDGGTVTDSASESAGESEGGSGCGCTTGGDDPMGAIGLALGLMLGITRRRRRV